MSTSTDGGETWTAHLAWQGAFDPSTKTGDNADKIFGTLAIDTHGQVHVVVPARHGDDPVSFVEDCETNPDCSEAPQSTDLELVTSPDQGASWTAPFALTTAAGSNFCPWIAAGSAGRIDAVYYTSSTLRPNDPSSVWYIGFAQITGARASVGGGSASYIQTPSVRSRLLDASPQHVGGICSFGIFCTVVPNANRSLADSIAISIDPGGGANAVWTNDATAAGNVIEFACQSSGPSAYAGEPSLSGCYRA